MIPPRATIGTPRNERIWGCARGHQPRKRGSLRMSSVRCGRSLSSIAPSSPCVRGSGPIAATSSSLIPDVMNCSNAPSPSGTPSAAYRAPASSRAASTSRCRTASTDSSAAIASTASLIACRAEVSRWSPVDAATPLTLRRGARRVVGRADEGRVGRSAEAGCSARPAAPPGGQAGRSSGSPASSRSSTSSASGGSCDSAGSSLLASRICSSRPLLPGRWSAPGMRPVWSVMSLSFRWRYLPRKSPDRAAPHRPPRPRRCERLRRRLLELDRVDADVVDRAVAAVGLRRPDAVDDVHPVAHLAEDRVLAVEPRRLFGRDDEELRAVRVRPRVRHRERALDDLVVVDLVLERVPRAAGAGPLGAAALDHEVLDDAVEDEPVVEALRRELLEVAHRLRGVLVEQLQDDVALARLHDGGGHDRSSSDRDRGRGRVRSGSGAERPGGRTAYPKTFSSEMRERAPCAGGCVIHSSSVRYLLVPAPSTMWLVPPSPTSALSVMCAQRVSVIVGGAVASSVA